MYDGILVKGEYSFEVHVKTQDSTENLGTFTNEEDARGAWSVGHEALNHSKMNPKDAPVYKVVPTVEYKLVRIK